MPSIAQDARFLAMACGAEGRFANRYNLLTASSRFMLSNEEAEAIIDKMAKLVQTGWYAILRRSGASDSDCSLVADAFIYKGFFNKK